jgi:uncharacterized protein (TIGR02284 family)
MAEVNSAVKTVIQVLHDGHEGFAQIGEHIKDPSAKTFFVEESATRQKFEHELKAAAGVTEDVGGTASGAVHRTWGDLKAHLGGGDHTLLETAEQGEDAAKKAYEEALKESNLNSTVRDLLVRQQQHILDSHNKVKALRDSTK